MRPTRNIITVFTGLFLLAIAGGQLADLAAQDETAEQPKAEKAALAETSTPAEKSGEVAADGKEEGSAEAGSGEQTDETASPEEAAPPPVKIPPPPPERPNRKDIELESYQVEIPIVFQPHPRMGPAFRQAVIDELYVIADRSIGPMWNLKITDGDWITPRSDQGIERITPEQIKKRQSEEAYFLAIHKQIAAHSEGKFSEVPSDPLDDETRARVRTILDTPEDNGQEELLREFVEAIGGGSVPEEKLDIASEVVFLYLTPSEMTLDKLYPVSVELNGSTYSVASSGVGPGIGTDDAPVRRRSTIDRRAVVAEISRLLNRSDRWFKSKPPDCVCSIRTMSSEQRFGRPCLASQQGHNVPYPAVRY